MSRLDLRRGIAAMAVLCICLAPIVAPCGDPEPSFDRDVRQHLIRAGYLNPLDVIEPFDASSRPDRCRLARAPSNCSCVSGLDGVAGRSGLRA
jgi:hypothetical protein